jgi:hypothetical protein
MAINQYGMPEGYDQAANPNARPAGPRRRSGPFQPAAGQNGTPMQPNEVDPTAWGTTPNGNAPQTHAPRQSPPQENDYTPNTPPMPTNTQPVAQPDYGAPGVNTPPAQPPVQAPGPLGGPLPGFDAAKWADTSHQSPKYVWGRAAAMFNLKTPEGRQQALAFAKQQAPHYFGNARLEGDKMFIDGSLHGDFNGLNSFDVIVDEEGAAVGAWQPFGAAYDAQQGQAQAAARQAAIQAEALRQSTQVYAPGQVPNTTAPQSFTPGVAPNIRPVVPMGNPQQTALQQTLAPQGAYQPVQAPQGDDLRTYDPVLGAIPEWNAPTFGPQEQAQMDALMGVLQNPGIPPQQLEQIKRIQQEQLMATRDETLDNTQENFLRRGLRGGALGAAERRTNEAYGADLTRSSRDIDIANAERRTGDILNASGALSSAMDGKFNRANTGFATGLNRSLAIEGLRGASADSYRGVYNDDAGWNLQNANLAEQIRQYDLAQQLALKNFLESQRQFDSGMGLSYAQLQQQQNAAVLRALGLA